MNIFIEKDKIFRDDISENGLCVYTALRYFYKTKVSEYFVSINHLSYIMFKRTGKRRDIEFIRSGLDNLIEIGFIKVVSKNSSFEYILDLSNINYDIEKDGYYVSISLSDLRTLLNIKNIKKGNLLKYFLVICSSFNNSSRLEEKYKNKIAKVTIDHLSTSSGIAYATCLKYNELLEEKELLFIFRNAFKSNKEKIFFNYYCRYDDINICKEFIGNPDYFDNNKSITQNSNYSRSMAQKYNALCKGKKYSISIIREIYDYCIEWNLTKKQEYEDSISKGYSCELKQKDLTIFKKYNLTN